MSRTPGLSDICCCCLGRVSGKELGICSKSSWVAYKECDKLDPPALVSLELALEVARVYNDATASILPAAVAPRVLNAKAPDAAFTQAVALRVRERIVVV